jgi:HEAT repeat protein
MCFFLSMPAACAGKAGRRAATAALLALTVLSAPAVSYGEYMVFRSLGITDTWWAVALSGIGSAWGAWPLIFAAKGLGALKDPAAIDVLAAQAQDWQADARTAASAIRALAQIGDRRAAPVVVKLLQTRNLDPLLLIEAVSAAGRVKAASATDLLLDMLLHPSPPVRAAALRSLAEIDPQGLVLVLSGLDPDRNWSVRAALASTLASLEPAAALPRLTVMLKDEDLRVIPSVLSALRALKAPGVERVLLDWLKHDDPVVRAAAATELGELKPAGGEAALAQAWRAAARDQMYVAKGAILAALAKYGRAAAEATLRLVSR